MAGHEVNTPAAPRRRTLRDSDGSRYGTVRLVVQAQGFDYAIASVVIERVGGGAIEGTRLGFCTLKRRDPSGLLLSPLQLLGQALDRLRSEP
jgi:hypothetical protein